VHRLLVNLSEIQQQFEVQYNCLLISNSNVLHTSEIARRIGKSFAQNFRFFAHNFAGLTVIWVHVAILFLASRVATLGQIVVRRWTCRLLMRLELDVSSRMIKAIPQD